AEGGVRPILEPVREGGQDLPLEVRPGMGRGHGTDVSRGRTAIHACAPTAILSRSETRSRFVSWGFAAGSGAWLRPSRGAVVAHLPLGEMPARLAGGAGTV